MKDDLISRLAAITIPILPVEHRKYQTMNIDDAYELGWFDCQNCIENLPSAEPERKKGEWIIEDDPRSEWYRVTCSECGEDVTSTVPMIGFFSNAKVLWDFCPYCGADMRGEQDE